jgi:hypothetical protein
MGKKKKNKQAITDDADRPAGILSRLGQTVTIPDPTGTAPPRTGQVVACTEAGFIRIPVHGSLAEEEQLRNWPGQPRKACVTVSLPRPPGCKMFHRDVCPSLVQWPESSSPTHSNHRMPIRQTKEPKRTWRPTTPIRQTKKPQPQQPQRTKSEPTPSPQRPQQQLPLQRPKSEPSPTPQRKQQFPQPQLPLQRPKSEPTPTQSPSPIRTGASPPAAPTSDVPPTRLSWGSGRSDGSKVSRGDRQKAQLSVPVNENLRKCLQRHCAEENEAAEKAAQAARIRFRERQVELCEQKNAIAAKLARHKERLQQRNAKSTAYVKPRGSVLRCMPLVGRWRTLQRFVVRKRVVRDVGPTPNATEAAKDATVRRKMQPFVVRKRVDRNVKPTPNATKATTDATVVRNLKMQTRSPIRTTTKYATVAASAATGSWYDLVTEARRKNADTGSLLPTHNPITSTTDKNASNAEQNLLRQLRQPTTPTTDQNASNAEQKPIRKTLRPTIPTTDKNAINAERKSIRQTLRPTTPTTDKNAINAEQKPTRQHLRLVSAVPVRRKRDLSPLKRQRQRSLSPLQRQRSLSPLQRNRLSPLKRQRCLLGPTLV